MEQMYGLVAGLALSACVKGNEALDQAKLYVAEVQDTSIDAVCSRQLAENLPIIAQSRTSDEVLGHSDVATRSQLPGNPAISAFLSTYGEKEGDYVFCNVVPELSDPLRVKGSYMGCSKWMKEFEKPSKNESYQSQLRLPTEQRPSEFTSMDHEYRQLVQWEEQMPTFLSKVQLATTLQRKSFSGKELANSDLQRAVRNADVMFEPWTYQEPSTFYGFMNSPVSKRILASDREVPLRSNLVSFSYVDTDSDGVTDGFSVRIFKGVDSNLRADIEPLLAQSEYDSITEQFSSKLDSLASIELVDMGGNGLAQDATDRLRLKDPQKEWKELPLLLTPTCVDHAILHTDIIGDYMNAFATYGMVLQEANALEQKALNAISDQIGSTVAYESSSLQRTIPSGLAELNGFDMVTFNRSISGSQNPFSMMRHLEGLVTSVRDDIAMPKVNTQAVDAGESILGL